MGTEEALRSEDGKEERVKEGKQRGGGVKGEAGRQREAGWQALLSASTHGHTNNTSPCTGVKRLTFAHFSRGMLTRRHKAGSGVSPRPLMPLDFPLPSLPFTFSCPLASSSLPFLSCYLCIPHSSLSQSFISLIFMFFPLLLTPIFFILRFLHPLFLVSHLSLISPLLSPVSPLFTCVFPVLYSCFVY